MLRKVCHSGTKSLLPTVKWPSKQRLFTNPSWFIPVIPWAEMTDWQVVTCWRSSEQYLLFPWSPGDGQATSPSTSAAPGHNGDKSTGVSRRRLHGDEARGWPQLRLTPLWSATLCLSGVLLPNSNCTQVEEITPTPTLKPFTLSVFVMFFKVSARTRGPTAHSSLSWQCYHCVACWELWWDVRLDLQVRAGPKRRCYAKGLPTLCVAHAQP